MHALAATAGTAPRFVDLAVPYWVWVVFVSAVSALLIADLVLVHRSPHAISLRAAAIESGVWVTLGLAFAGVLAVGYGGPAAGEYLAGYLIEKSLSIDNVFIWAVIFSFFGVPREFQFRVLFWGVFGALVLRAAFIFAGVALIERFDWVLYAFGALLVFSAVKIARHQEAEVHPETNPVFRVVRRFVPATSEYDGQRLFTRVSGRLVATPLFVVLVLVESTDVVFAVDSIPAILGVSREPFLVFAANAFAILGLRAMYFLLSGAAVHLRYLHVGLAAILGFVGVKMLFAELYHVPTWASLAVIVCVLGVTVAVSLRGHVAAGR